MATAGGGQSNATPSDEGNGEDLIRTQCFARAVGTFSDLPRGSTALAQSHTLARLSQSLFPIPEEESGQEDPALHRVAAWFRSEPDYVARFGAAIRQSLDEVLDGQRTGRFDFADLEPPEKSYLGTKVEIVLQDVFELARGGPKTMDYVVDGVPVDCKWSSHRHGWMIPTEAVGEICLLTWASDPESKFSVGLIRTTDARLNAGKNKDGKRSIKASARSEIQWLVHDGKLPENFLLRLDAPTRDAILAAGSRQARLVELFRQVHTRIIPRQAIVTLGQQTDALRRARHCRTPLKDEGVRILCGTWKADRAIAQELGLPKLNSGEWLAYSTNDYPDELLPAEDVEDLLSDSPRE